MEGEHIGRQKEEEKLETEHWHECQMHTTTQHADPHCVQPLFPFSEQSSLLAFVKSLPEV